MNGLIRGVGLRDAVAVNVITMIGIGPLITIPLVLGYLNGPLALVGWIAGAIVALCDGLVWAELSSRFPGSGGTYVYLRETFGPHGWGRALAFLFNWQFLLYAPLILASGYIGFANYAGYFSPALAASPGLKHALEIVLGVVTTALLYRRITTIARESFYLGVAAVLTILLVVAAALPHADFHRALTLDRPFTFGLGFLAGLGGSLFITLYDYVGYAQAALLGDEVRDANRTIPRAIVISIVVVAVLYLTLQVGVLGVVPWQELVGKNGGPPPDAAQYVAATVVERTWGPIAARAVTIFILITAFASLFGNLLGFSRIPYAAARDNAFIPAFAKLHRRGNFPYVSLLVIGALSLVATFFTLDQVIAMLTAGIVLIQSIAQIVALAVLRARREPAPFRMWLFPLPAAVAAAGWLLAFFYSGPRAIAYGVGWLVLGALVYVCVAYRQRAWPFVRALAILAAMGCTFAPWARAAAPWRGSAIVQRAGYPVFTVGKKPFFVYGAAFFYERLPRDEWEPSLRAYRAMGINTIDLYVIWNWHELADGTFDFTGRTNPRRDLAGLLRMTHRLGFKLVVRPGPVIRNEWKNGGYPDWLLERPEYRMPLHDVLEGRYPATATLQNAHSDDAAAEWMANATHVRYATRWLTTALREFSPVRNDVIAIALDDDQGAYIDNQTWPAPHFQTYMRRLQAIVRSVTGPRVPAFINTYQMKVTASAPVWAWGNWYQSDAYAIGDHDRAQLEFSTALLQTQRHLPVMASEFQAGWLQGAAEGAPRPADPTNTTLALHTMLQYGMRGVVNFPVQDTVNPSGWEAPWANWSYAWDAALAGGNAYGSPGAPLQRNARYAPTAAFGRMTHTYGSLLAATHRVAPFAIVWTVGAYDPVRITNADIGQIAARTIAELQACDARSIACDLIDARYVDAATLQRYAAIVFPHVRLPSGATLDADYERRYSHAVESAGELPPSPLRLAADATLLTGAAGSDTYGFIDVANWSSRARVIEPMRVSLAGRWIETPRLELPARSATLLPLEVPLRALDSRFGAGDRITSGQCLPELVRHAGGLAMTAQTACALNLRIGGKVVRVALSRGSATLVTFDGHERAYRTASGTPAAACCNIHGFEFARHYWALPSMATSASHASIYDALREGSPMRFLANDRLELGISPTAGARAADFSPRPSGGNVASSIGLFRDDVLIPPAPSPRDYIAKYTHDLSAGTFNRAYACIATDASMRCAYDAPDFPQGGARFERTFRLTPEGELALTERLTLYAPNPDQRLVSLSGFAAPEGGDTVLHSSSGIALYDASTHRAVIATWAGNDVERATVTPARRAALLRLVLPATRYATVYFAIRRADSLSVAQGELEAAQGRREADANRP